MKNWERFKNWHDARTHYEENCVPALTRMEWGIGAWMYMDHVDGESRLDFLRRCDHAAFGGGGSILTAVGTKELKRLEKKEGGAA